MGPVQHPNIETWTCYTPSKGHKINVSPPPLSHVKLNLILKQGSNNESKVVLAKYRLQNVNSDGYPCVEK